MANEKILVVDDDANICELLRLYLTKEGYQVTVANDGEEGLEKFNAVKPDMVLLDVMMPRMDGLEVCRRIRKAGNTPAMMLRSAPSSAASRTARSRARSSTALHGGSTTTRSAWKSRCPVWPASACWATSSVC